ncbi:hypothetical protein XELAEV_18041653mg [Xenopus laevis]|uniref:Secreted protein n=1 Tax=Xenopus laevis TaxID=8355 RepID=A0A974C2I4_XENLA|nr:hypothetical protein XELAEV_18041653mg [Xenopus laevis]
MTKLFLVLSVPASAGLTPPTSSFPYPPVSRYCVQGLWAVQAQHGAEQWRCCIAVVLCFSADGCNSFQRREGLSLLCMGRHCLVFHSPIFHWGKEFCLTQAATPSTPHWVAIRICGFPLEQSQGPILRAWKGH